MITDYDPVPGEDTSQLPPDSVTEFYNAKTFLQTVSPETGDNLYFFICYLI